MMLKSVPFTACVNVSMKHCFLAYLTGISVNPTRARRSHLTKGCFITKSMQEKESIMVDRCELKIPSLGRTVRHHSSSLVMQNSCPRDGIFNPHLIIIKDSYKLKHNNRTHYMNEIRL